MENVIIDYTPQLIEIIDALSRIEILFQYLLGALGFIFAFMFIKFCIDAWGRF